MDEDLADRRRRILMPKEAALAVRQGILQSARDCQDWGYDWPSDRGCESLLQVRAAEQLISIIRSFRLGWLTLEEPTANISSTGSRKLGRPFAGMTEQQRSDIAIWSKSWFVYAIVEIKRIEQQINWQKDLVKISRMLRTYGRSVGGSLRYGIFGAFLSCKDHNALACRRQKLADTANGVAKEFKLRARTSLSDEYHIWPDSSYGQWICGAATVVLTTR